MYRPARSFALPKIKIARFDPQATSTVSDE
jgi:hypothetical protein